MTLGGVTLYQNKALHQRNIDLEDKQYINNHRLKLLQSDFKIKIFSGSECTLDVVDMVGGIASLVYENSSLEINSPRKWFIFTLRCANFNPPIQFRVKEVDIYVKDDETQFSGYPKSKKYKFINDSSNFSGSIVEINDNKIYFGFDLQHNKSELSFLNDSRNQIFTVKGLIEILSNEDVISLYSFRTLFFTGETDHIPRITTTFLRGKILYFEEDEV